TGRASSVRPLPVAIRRPCSGRAATGESAVGGRGVPGAGDGGPARSRAIRRPGAPFRGAARPRTSGRREPERGPISDSRTPPLTTGARPVPPPRSLHNGRSAAVGFVSEALLRKESEDQAVRSFGARARAPEWRPIVSSHSVKREGHGRVSAADVDPTPTAAGG